MNRYPVAYKRGAGQPSGGLSMPKTKVVERSFLFDLFRANSMIGRLSGNAGDSYAPPFGGGGGDYGGGGAGGSWQPEDGSPIGKSESLLETHFMDRPTYSNSCYEYRSCPGNGVTDHYGTGGLNTHSGPPTTTTTGFNTCAQTLLNTVNQRPTLLECLAINPFISQGRHTISPLQRKVTESWCLLNTPACLGNQGMWKEPFTGFRIRFDGVEPDYPRWRDGVAPPGTQPTEDVRREPAPLSMPDLEVAFAVPRKVPVRAKVTPRKVIRRPNSGRPVRAGKNTIEGKWNVRSKLGRFWVGINMATEAEDLIKDLHGALPKKCQEKPWRPDGTRTKARHMLRAIYRCGGEMDVGLAMGNFINSQIADWYYGNIIGKSGKAVNQKFGLPTGGTRAVSEAVGDSLPKPPQIDFSNPSKVDFQNQGDIWWVVLGE